ncbi:MAG: tryptophan synthase subunit alpha [Dehalococcoidia bacterium]
MIERIPGRIEGAFDRMKAERRTGFIAFVTAGYPDLASTPGLVRALVDGGADIIEIGIPFSDPLADGPTIQRASFRALEQGVTVKDCLEVTRQLRADGLQAAIVYMGYYNPMLAYGIEEFARDAADAGADGVIPVDVPPEESGPLQEACERKGLRVIYLVAPTSTEERITAVAERASGFIYCVSVTGVTSARAELPADLEEFIRRVRNHTNLPIAVGFGISQPEHFEAVGRIADAAVIGSAIVDEITKSDPSEREARLRHYAEVVTGRRGAAR